MPYKRFAGENFVSELEPKSFMTFRDRISW